MRYFPLRYEDMVMDQEANVRRMLAFIGVEFDPRCLSFEQNTRYARTASYAQVTEKLYDRSRYRYRPYLKHLTPLLESFGPAIERLGYNIDQGERDMIKQPFTIAVVLTLLGAVPFLALGAIVLMEPLAAQTAIEVLISYGAVVLSFLGAVHWGFALRDSAHPVNGEPLPPAMLGAERQLLVFGIIPALIGWVALSLMLHFNAPALALFLILVGFLVTIVAESIGQGRGVVALNYLLLRWVASVIVMVTLLAVLLAVLTGMRMG